MQERYRIFRRAGGNFYTRDKITGKSESLETADRVAAKQILAAKAVGSRHDLGAFTS